VPNDVSIGGRPSALELLQGEAQAGHKAGSPMPALAAWPWTIPKIKRIRESKLKQSIGSWRKSESGGCRRVLSSLLVSLHSKRPAAVTQRIGVIGGSGFIGAWLVELLLTEDHAVRIIDVNPSELHPDLWVAADVRDRDALYAACRGCDRLYNLAAEHRDDVRPIELYHQVNVLGAHNTCDVAERLHIDRLIFTSTVAVYGLPEDEVDETAATRPFNEYGRTKLEAEQVFRAWAERAPGRSLTIVRPTVVFGPNNRGNVYLLLKQIASGRSIVIGDGRNRKSMAYVGNLAEFLVYALRFGLGVHLYNYVDKPDLDMNGLVAVVNQTLDRAQSLRIPYSLGMAAGAGCDWLAQLTGYQFPISRVRVRKYAANTRFAANRIASTGFTPRHSLHEALAATIRQEFTDDGVQAAPSQAPLLSHWLDR
jgi:nucleoside-diphosphate-sugar epimerase